MSDNKVYNWTDGLLEPEKVSILDLSNENLTEIELDILVFDSLEKLILDHNPGIKVLPEELEFLPRIRMVSMKGCDVCLLSGLSVFPNLEVLDISEMHIPNLDSLNGICQVKTIKEIIMNDCTHPYMKDLYNLNFKLPPELGNLTYLEKLSVDHCYLETLPDTLTYLEHLQYLSVKNNYLKRLPKGLLEIPSLREFYAEGNSLDREKTRIIKLINEKPNFITDLDVKRSQEISETDHSVNETLLSAEIISELRQLGIPEVKTDCEARYFTHPETGEEVIIAPALVQLLWGFDWSKTKLLWKEPPFSCEESWNDGAYSEGNSYDIEKEKSVEISYAYYLEESFCINQEDYLCIGFFQIDGDPYRIGISLKEECMENPNVFIHQYEWEEATQFDTLLDFLK
ncbi:MAG: leucine-rich repeat domain-containing protein, partial [Clostridiales bacterium]|nr:leucine-rich repeat domain-containing protein [Clostridiales bacterium]